MLDDGALGGILISSGLINASQLQQISSIARSRGQSLYHVAIEMQAVPEHALVAAVADAIGVQSVSLHGFQRDEGLAKLIPADVVSQRQILPVGVSQDGGQQQLFLAMADPSDAELIAWVERHTGSAVIPVLAGPGDLAAAIERCGTPMSGFVRSRAPTGHKATARPAHEDFGALAAASEGLSGMLDMLDDEPAKSSRDAQATPRSGLLPVGAMSDFGREERTGAYGAIPASDAVNQMPADALIRATVRALIRKGYLTSADLEESG